jgi:hypothetical protein
MIFFVDNSLDPSRKVLHFIHKVFLRLSSFVENER